MIAESYERIHRSNLVGMGIIPLQYLPEQNAESLGLTGKESYSIELPRDLKTGQTLQVKVKAFAEMEKVSEPGNLVLRNVWGSTFLQKFTFFDVL